MRVRWAKCQDCTIHALQSVSSQMCGYLDISMLTCILSQCHRYLHYDGFEMIAAIFSDMHFAFTIIANVICELPTFLW